MNAPPLVAVVHGSRSPAATAASRTLFTALRRARPGLVVHEAFLDHGTPRLADLVANLNQPFVVAPVLLGAAYHSRVDIPAALAGRTAPAAQANVLGPDLLLLAAMERRLNQVGVSTGDPSMAVVLAAAGSADATSVDAVHTLAADWRAAGWWDVRAAFASAAEPSVRQAVTDLRAAGAPRIAVASYLLFPGMFFDTLAASGADVVSEPLADAPEVVGLILARYDAACANVPTSEIPAALR